MDKEMSKAKTVIHAEYEILKAVIDRVPLDEVHHFMVRDSASATRFEKAANNVATLINNLAERRKHRLPFDHPDYKLKGGRGEEQ